MSSCIQLPHEIYKPATRRRRYHLYLTAGHRPDPVNAPSSPPSSQPMVWLSLLVSHYDPNLGAASPCHQRIFLFRLCDLLASPSVDGVVAAILSEWDLDSGSRECKQMHRFVSCFVHQAARKSKGDTGGSQSISAIVSVLLVRCPAADISDNGDSECGTEIRELPETCPICLNDFSFCNGEVIVSTQCFHAFHKECHAPWFGRGNNHCPVCRETCYNN